MVSVTAKARLLRFAPCWRQGRRFATGDAVEPMPKVAVRRGISRGEGPRDRYGLRTPTPFEAVPRDECC